MTFLWRCRRSRRSSRTSRTGWSGLSSILAGFEVGNAFSELNDPDDQLRRFEAQIEERKRGDEEAMAEVDHDYVRALGYGLPPTAGEGIGIDRLTMILTG